MNICKWICTGNCSRGCACVRAGIIYLPVTDVEVPVSLIDILKVTVSEEVEIKTNLQPGCEAGMLVCMPVKTKLQDG